MNMSLGLVATVLAPAVMGGLILLMGNRAARGIACVASLGVAGAAGILAWTALGPDGVLTPIEYDRPWLGTGAALDLRFHLALDGLVLWLFVLSAMLFVTAVLVSWKAIDREQRLFYALLLLLETGCLGVFTAQDVLLFYVFFEFTLIPLFFLIGIWGSEDRRRAAGKFFLFTLAGSLLTFLGLLAIVLWSYWAEEASRVATFDIATLTTSLARHPLPGWLEHLVFWALFAGFAIKVPLFPLHTWLPLAHVQAPTAGSVILAGLLLKIGTYGFLRFSIPMLPNASVAASPWILSLAAAGIVYGALVALAQGDLKRLIAYSSVSHLGYCLLGLFALNPVGIEGSLLQMVNHGISTGALFAIVGMIYERYHTRNIRDLGGLAGAHPWLAFFMLLFTFSSIGLPGLNGFAGEILILTGTFQRAWGGTGTWLLRGVSLAALSGVVLGAWYMLWLVQRVFFGLPRTGADGTEGSGNPGSHGLAHDMSWREVFAVLPLAIAAVSIGICPEYFLRPARGELVALTREAASREIVIQNPAPLGSPTADVVFTSSNPSERRLVSDDAH